MLRLNELIDALLLEQGVRNGRLHDFDYDSPVTGEDKILPTEYSIKPPERIVDPKTGHVTYRR